MTANIDAREWLEDFDRAKLLTQELRDGLRLGRKGDLTKKVSNVQAVVAALEEQLGQLESAPDRYHVSVKELNRRRSRLGELKKDLNIVVQTYSSQGRYQASSVTPQDLKGYSANDILQMQRHVIKEQDDQLLEIEKGVGNLKEYSRAVHDEASLHVKLLDEMDKDMDEASAGLRAEAERARQVANRASTFKLKLTIVILTLILILLLILGASK